MGEGGPVTMLRSTFLLSADEFDPEEVTRRLGLLPTRTWRLGDPVPGTLLRRKSTAWLIDSGKEATVDLAEQATRVLGPAFSQESAVSRLRQELGLTVTLSCAVYLENERPDIHFSPDLLIGLTRLRAEIDVAVYGR